MNSPRGASTQRSRGAPACGKAQEPAVPGASRVAGASESVDALSGNRLPTTQAATRESAAARVQGTAPGLAAETRTGDGARPRLATRASRPTDRPRPLPLRTGPATPRSSPAPPGRLEPRPRRGGPEPHPAAPGLTPTDAEGSPARLHRRRRRSPARTR